MNQNGLLSSNDVSATGDTSSNFFLRKGQPIAVLSPLQIISPDTTKVTTISVDNSGSTVIDSELDLTFANNDGNVFFQAPDGSRLGVNVANGGDTTFQTVGVAQLTLVSDGITTIAPAVQTSGNGALRIQNGTACPVPANFVTYVGGQSSGGLTIGNLQTYAYIGSNINKVLDISPLGNAVSIGSAATVGGAVVTVDGPSGVSRVLDPIYNPPSTSTFITLFDYNVPGNQRGLISRPGDPELYNLKTGIYQLSAYYNNIVVNSFTTMDIGLFEVFGDLLIKSQTRIVAEEGTTSGAGSYVTTVSNLFQITNTTNSLFGLYVNFDGEQRDPLDSWTSDNFSYTLVKIA